RTRRPPPVKGGSQSRGGPHNATSWRRWGRDQQPGNGPCRAGPEPWDVLAGTGVPSGRRDAAARGASRAGVVPAVLRRRPRSWLGHPTGTSRSYETGRPRTEPRLYPNRPPRRPDRRSHPVVEKRRNAWRSLGIGVYVGTRGRASGTLRSSAPSAPLTEWRGSDVG